MSIPRKLLYVATTAIDSRNKDLIFEVIDSLENNLTVIKREYGETLASLQALNQQLSTGNGALTHLVIEVAKIRTYDASLELRYERVTDLVNNLLNVIESVRHKGVKQREAMGALHKSCSALRSFANSLD